MCPDDTMECSRIEAFDPNNKDIVYLRVGDGIIKCNILTREWTKIVENWPTIKYGQDPYFPVEMVANTSS